MVDRGARRGKGLIGKISSGRRVLGEVVPLGEEGPVFLGTKKKKKTGGGRKRTTTWNTKGKKEKTQLAPHLGGKN